MHELRGLLRAAGPRLWLSALAGLIAGLAEAAVVVLVVAAALALSDDALPGVTLPLIPSDAGAGLLVALGLVGAAVRTGAALAGLRLSTTARADVEANYQKDLVRAYLEASWEEVATRPEGELQELASAQSALGAVGVLNAMQAVQAALSFAMLVATSVVVSPATAGATIFGAGLLALLLRPIAGVVSRRTRRRVGHDLDVAALTAESVRLAEEVAVFGVGSAQADRASRSIEQKRRVGASADFAAAITPVAYQGAVFVLVFAGLGALVVAGVRVGTELGAIVLLLLRAFAYSQQAQHAWVSALSTMPRGRVVVGATAALAASRPRSDGQELDRIVSCELAGVTYRYPSGQQALTDIDLRLCLGEALGVAGPSGAGKSTLVQLLLRLRAPTEGRHLVNGHPASTYDAHGWARQVSLVPQEPKLIEGTIADNIRFLRSGITDDQIQRASRLAGLDRDLAACPEGHERLVGPRHRALSGGQRQRIVIARALAGEPSLLVLDEPTSALDVECERVIQETLAGLQGVVTMVVIAHRLTTLQLCGRILLLREGRIEAHGSPSEVIRRGGEVGAALRAAGLS
jgi:ABC-type multidrug transport system fused ATPase/permease subunit